MSAKRFEVRLTLGAENDLERIYDYYSAIGSGVDPDALLDSLRAKAAQLETFPMRGNVPKELDGLGRRDFRQIVLPPYRLIYRVVEDIVQIVLIADGRRDMRALLEARVLD